MPRIRGFYREPRTLVHLRRKPQQLSRLLLQNSLRITTSRLSNESLGKVLDASQPPRHRHIDVKGSRIPGSLRDHNEVQIIAIKDNFVTRDLPTTCASHILEGFAAEDATAVRLLKEAGLSIVAKTNMDEFGMGSHSTNSVYGAVRHGSSRNPLSAGGSSGGSALAVASGLVDAALGSDTGGSVRLPAAYTGIVGFKPSYGMISRRGLIPYANSLDTVGLFGQTANDVWMLFRVLAKYDSEDPTSISDNTRKRIETARWKRTERDYAFSFVASSRTRDSERKASYRTDPELSIVRPRTRRIGVPVEYNIAELHPSVRSAWIRTLSNLQYLGHDIVPISLPSTQQALSAYYVLAPAEASSNLSKYDGVRYGKLRDADSVDDAGGTLYSNYRGAHFGEEVQRRILLGSFTLSAGAIDNYFIQAQRVRRIVQSDFDMVFRMANPLLPDRKSNRNGVDFIICPTAPTPPPKLSEVRSADPLDSYINDVFTVPASLAGLPAISVPAPTEGHHRARSDSAVGMQVIGQFGDDLGVIHFARKWLDHETQRERSYFGKRPRFR